MYPEILDQLPGAMLGERGVRTPITGRSGGSREEAGCSYGFLWRDGEMSLTRWDHLGFEYLPFATMKLLMIG